MRRAALPLALALAAMLLPLAAAGPVHARSAAKIRSAAATWASKQVGVRERGTTNCSPIVNRWVRAMGLRIPPCRPWCGSLPHQAYLRQGVRLSARLIDPHRTYFDVLAGKRHLRRIAVGSVRRGDLLLLRLRPGVRASHIAIVRGRPRGGMVPTVEANVSHAVRFKRRGLRYPVLAARVVP